MVSPGIKEMYQLLYMDFKEDFGRKLIEEVRDRTLDYYVRLSRAELKSQSDKILSDRVQSLSAEERELLKEMVLRITDMSLHNMMFFFENEPTSGWRIVHPLSGVDLVESSDGLCGELYSEEGWISRYSKYDSSLE